MVYPTLKNSIGAQSSGLFYWVDQPNHATVAVVWAECRSWSRQRNRRAERGRELQREPPFTLVTNTQRNRRILEFWRPFTRVSSLTSSILLKMVVPELTGLITMPPVSSPGSYSSMIMASAGNLLLQLNLIELPTSFFS